MKVSNKIHLTAEWNEDFLFGVQNFDGVCDSCDAVHNITRIGLGVFGFVLTIDK